MWISKRLLSALALVAVAVLLAAACGSDDGSEGTQEELVEAVESYYSSLYAAQFEEVYEQWSERCQDFKTLEAYAEDAEDNIFGFEQGTGESWAGLSIVDVEVLDFDEGNSAIVTFDLVHDENDLFDVEVVNETAWVYEDGWRYDSCEGPALFG